MWRTLWCWRMLPSAHAASVWNSRRDSWRFFRVSRETRSSSSLKMALQSFNLFRRFLWIVLRCIAREICIGFFFGGWGGGWRVPFLYSFSSLPPPVMITYKSCFENDSNESGVRARALSILPNFHWPFWPISLHFLPIFTAFFFLSFIFSVIYWRFHQRCGGHRREDWPWRPQSPLDGADDRFTPFPPSPLQNSAYCYYHH